MDQPSTSQSTRWSRPLMEHRPTESSNPQTEKTALKADYLKLIDESNAIAGNPNVHQSIIDMNNVLDKADSLFTRVKDTSQLFLDAQIIHSSASTLEQTTLNVEVGEGNFRLFTFAEQFKMKALSREGQPLWEILAAVAQPVVHNSIPSWSPLLGSFEFSAEESEPQQPKVRKRIQKDVDVEKKEPEKLSQIDKVHAGVEEIVERIFVKLKKLYRKNDKQPLNYFKFVIDPNSFSKSVENIFHVSFLVNDGFVRLEIDDDEPMISPVPKGKENSSPEEVENQEKTKKQNIISMDKQTWKDLVAAMKITEAMI